MLYRERLNIFFFLGQPKKEENIENAIDSHGQMRFFDELECKHYYYYAYNIL